MKTKIMYLLLGGLIAVVATVSFNWYGKFGEKYLVPDVEQAQMHIRQSFPNIEVDKVMPTPLKDFYAVVADGRVYYLSREGAFLMAGTLYDLLEDIDITEAIKASLRKESVAGIQAGNLLTYAPENERYVVRVFSDVDCPYCRKLHSQLQDFHKHGIRFDYIIVPFRGDEARRKAIGVWCSDDPHAAMDQGMRGAPVETASCEEHPIDDNLRLARSLGVGATPAFLFEDGRLIIGYRPVQDLLHELRNPPASPKG